MTEFQVFNKRIEEIAKEEGIPVTEVDRSACRKLWDAATAWQREESARLCEKHYGSFREYNEVGKRMANTIRKQSREESK